MEKLTQEEGVTEEDILNAMKEFKASWDESMKEFKASMDRLEASWEEFTAELSKKIDRNSRSIADINNRGGRIGPPGFREALGHGSAVGGPNRMVNRAYYR